MIVDQDQLKRVTGYQRAGDLERWLRQNRIRYWRGKAGAIFTTEAMIEASQTATKQSPASEIEF